MSPLFNRGWPRWERKSPEEELQTLIESNRTYPFHRSNDGTTFEFSVISPYFYISILSFLASLSWTAYWISIRYFANLFFPLPFLFLIITAAAVLNFKDRRTYTLHPDANQYAFVLNGNVHVRGELYNIYVRLKKEVRSGRKKYYHLILNGFQMDARKLCRSSTNVDRLRELGKLIAENLNLSYFDESNSSPHHVIRHFRPDKNPFSFI
ncbi:hypothetical protein BJ742DRAFT_819604 [Cladochytrium replicatum]|nr:hypothetical protein BJ742DRAFT_819604 [Cladochytrium replicatum]